MIISMAPARSISSRTTASTLRSTRRPSGDQVYRPAASLRIMPARSISRWLASSASAGVSLVVCRWKRDRRIAGRDRGAEPDILPAIHPKRSARPIGPVAGARGLAGPVTRVVRGIQLPAGGQ